MSHEKSEKSADSLGSMIDRLIDVAQEEKSVSFESMMSAVGRRSFGPLVLMIGLIAMSPLSGIPTVPSILGGIVVLVAGQLALGRQHFWIPRRLLRREVSAGKLERGLRAVQPVGRTVDRFLKPRLTFLTRGVGAYVMALLCVVVGATMPPLEILPFLATSAGVALTAFGLSLTANDGLFGLIAIVSTLGVFYLVVSNWPF